MAIFQRSNDNPPDPQHVPNPGAEADSAIDIDAEEMASKAGDLEKKNESSDTVGGVRSNSGGIFSK